MRDKEFISDHLVNIRERLKAYSKDQAENTNPLPPKAVANNDTARSVDSSAVRRRISEAQKSKAELEELLAGDIAYLTQRIQLQTEQLQELQNTAKSILNTPDSPTGTTPAEAGTFFRRIEEVRLDYIRCLAKYSQRQEEQHLQKPRETGGFPNYFGGQLRAGAAFNLILAASIVAASIISGLFFFAAINGGL